MTTRFGFVSTYPPTICGLATFTAALYAELVTSGGEPGRVVRVVDTAQRPAGARLAGGGVAGAGVAGGGVTSAEMAGDLVAGDPSSVERAAAVLNEGDIAIVQHEYGVYGGPDGDEILALLRAVKVPSVVVLHTVLSAPTTHQREVLEAVAALAGAVVTMTATAHDRLATGYAVDMTKVSVIPHGAPAVRSGYAPVFRSIEPTVLTWGLIGPGKGIEWGIEAMASLTDLYPAPRYVVAGQTHPKVLLREGEAYRVGLKERVRRLALTGTVTFDSHYRNAEALDELISSADVVLLPYDSTDQVTSGVLIEAVAALKPVVATRFPHAVEMLSNGAGLLVDHKDPRAIADALRTLFTHRELAAGMTKAAVATAPDLRWAAVAQRYRDLAAQLIHSRVAA